MKKTGKKLTALLLAVCLLLSLAACGKDEGPDGEQLSANVYVPTFTDLDVDADSIERVCVSGNYIFMVGPVYHEEEVTETDPETGEEYVNYQYDYQYYLYRVPLEGGGAVKLENYQPIQNTENEDGYTYINDLTAGEDGTIWVTEVIPGTVYDLPEDFDEETDDRENYAQYQETTVRRQLDAEGNEITRSEDENGGQNALAERLGVEWINGVYHDSKGNSYVATESFIAVMDSQGAELFRVEGSNLWGDMLELSDGSMGMSIYSYDEETETSSQVLRTIDLEAKDWGAEYPLPYNLYGTYSGGGDYLFYYRNGDSIYGYKKDTAAGEKLFSWLDADVNSDDVLAFEFLPDGQVVAVTNTWDGETHKTELVTLNAVPRSEMPEKTTLTFGAMYLDSNMRKAIIDFNKASTTHHIEVRDYSEMITDGDYSSGLSILNTEMIAGKVPDILYTSGLPVQQYGSRGMLEDLWSWIDNDPDLGRDSIMEPVFNAVSQDGKLYQVFNSYNVQTVVASSDVVGDRMSWNLADLRAALETMPEGCLIFGQYDTKLGMLSSVLAQNMDSFVDWSTGECSFDTDEFKSLLEFCNSFPDEYDWEQGGDSSVAVEPYESDYARILSGRQLLVRSWVSSLNWGTIEELEAVFDGKYSYIGYPQEDGGVGSYFSVYDGLAMSATCKDKDAAWSFMRQMLLPQSGDSYYGGLPVNREDFEKAAEDAMRLYEVDENGETLLDEEGNPVPRMTNTVWVDDNTQIETKPLSQEALDKFMTLFNSITKVYNYDDRIYEIVSDVAGGYFAGDTPLDSAATRIQSQVKLYVNENR